MTDELKKAIENAQTEEEKTAVVEKFKDELKKLSEEELEGVTGGHTHNWNPIAFFYEDTVNAEVKPL